MDEKTPYNAPEATETPREGKLAFCHRVQRAGLWGDVTARLDDVRRELRRQGVRRAEARDQAWEVVMAEYPPPAPAGGSQASTPPPPEFPGHDDPDIAAELQELVARTEQQEAPLNVRADVEWVFNHLGAPVRPLDAPNSGAWGLLQTARQDPDWFLARILRLALPRRRAPLGGEELGRPKVYKEDLELIEDIRWMLAQHRAAKTSGRG